MKSFLLRSAFLPRMTARMAQGMTDNPRAGEILSYLSRNNYFTETHPAPEPVFQYHALFREFLLLRAQSAFPGAEGQEIRREAASILLEGGQAEDAVEHLRATGDWSGLARVILREAPSLIGQGRNRVLSDWIRQLPEETFPCHAVARLLARRGDPSVRTGGRAAPLRGVPVAVPAGERCRGGVPLLVRHRPGGVVRRGWVRVLRLVPSHPGRPPAGVRRIPVPGDRGAGALRHDPGAGELGAEHRGRRCMDRPRPGRRGGHLRHLAEMYFAHEGVELLDGPGIQHRRGEFAVRVALTPHAVERRPVDRPDRNVPLCRSQFPFRGRIRPVPRGRRGGAQIRGSGRSSHFRHVAAGKGDASGAAQRGRARRKEQFPPDGLPPSEGDAARCDLLLPHRRR